VTEISRQDAKPQRRNAQEAIGRIWDDDVIDLRHVVERRAQYDAEDRARVRLNRLGRVSGG